MVRDVVAEVARHCESAEWEGTDENDDKEAATLLLNSDKAGRLLGWHPRWTFERAIEETMKGYAGKPMAQTIEDYLAS